METVSTEHLRMVVALANQRIGLVDTMAALMAMELLAYRDGFDPKERLPDYDVPVRIRWEWEGTRCQTIATRAIYDGVEIWLPTNDGCNYVPLELVFRWHPLPGGE